MRGRQQSDQFDDQRPVVFYATKVVLLTWCVQALHGSWLWSTLSVLQALPVGWPVPSAAG